MPTLITMSNIGKQIITIESGIQVEQQDNVIVVKGPKGELSMTLPKGIGIEMGESSVKVKKLNDSPQNAKFYGLARAILANLVTGVSRGFEKKLELVGVGYRAKVEGRDLVLNVGFSNSVRLTPREGVSVAVNENIIIITGANKQLVGDFAAEVRKIRPPEPYKGKGIKYVDEIIKRKAGKTAKAGA